MSDVTVRKVLATLGWKVDDAKLKAANKEVDKTKREVDKTQQAVKKLEGDFGKAASAAQLGFGKASRAAATMRGEIDKVGKGGGFLDKQLAGIGSKLGALLAVEGLQKVGQFLGESATRMGELDAATAALPGGLEAARAATEGLADRFTLATAGASALRGELIANGDQFGAFAGDVAKLARRAGADVGGSITQMVAELRSGSTALLDQWGVTVDAEGAVKAYAAAHNKLVEDLTDTEKRHVIATAAIRAMHDAASGLGPVLETNATRLQRASAKVGDFKDGLRDLAVMVAGTAVGAVERFSEVVAEQTLGVSRLSDEIDTLDGKTEGLAKSWLDAAVNLTIGSEALQDLLDKVGKLGRLKTVRDADGNVVSVYEDTSADPYQMTPAELRAQKAIEAEMQAHEDAAARAALQYGPELPPATKGKGGGGKVPKPKKPGEEYFNTTVGDPLVAALLRESGYESGGKTAKQRSLEELYGELRRAPDEAIAAHLEPGRESEIGKHFKELITGGSPAGMGPDGGGAQGLGTRIVNVDARIEANIEVVAPDGLVGAGDVAARRVAQDLGRDIGAELDPYFGDQATVIRRAVEG